MSEGSARQAVAQSLSEFLHRRGAWVTSPLPLRGDRPLRFDCRSLDAPALTSKLGSMGFAVRFRGTAQQMRPAAVRTQYVEEGTKQTKVRYHGGPVDCTTFEIDLPRDRKSDDGHAIATAEDRERNRRYLLGGDPMAGM